jgi:uncharacterized coiled-coil DUF342 family protein
VPAKRAVSIPRSEDDAWKIQQQRLLREIEELRSQLRGNLSRTRKQRDDAEASLRETLEDFLDNPSRDIHRALAETVSEYRRTWAALEAEEKRRSK